MSQQGGAGGGAGGAGVGGGAGGGAGAGRDSDPTEWIAQAPPRPAVGWGPWQQDGNMGGGGQHADAPTEHFLPLAHGAGSHLENQSGRVQPAAYPQTFGPDTGEQIAYQPPSRQNTGLWILVMSLVLILGLLLGVSAYFLYAGFPNQQPFEDPATETTAEAGDAGAGDAGAGDSIGEDLPITSQAESPPEESTDGIGGVSGKRPTEVNLPADAKPANLFARTGYKNGMLFNLYVAGGATEEFALSVHTAYRTKWPGFEPPRGEHYLSVTVSGRGDVDVACNDTGSYVLCSTAAGEKVYIV